MPSELSSSEDDAASSARESAPHAEVSDLPLADPAYIALLDRYIDSFFSLEYDMPPGPHLAQKQPLLDSSKITVTRAYYCPEKGANPLVSDPSIAGNLLQSELEITGQPPRQENNFEAVPGTLWTAAEKEAFFRCLARYSIHRIDCFLDYLPHKSEGEILQYYNLLKKELGDLETYREHTVTFRDVDAAPKDKVVHRYLTKAFENGISYEEIPIACELSEAWIAYENEQSSLINSREYHLALNKERALRKSMAYKYGETVGSVNDLHELGILNAKGLIKLQRIYRASAYAQDVGRKQVRVFGFEAMVLLNELIRQRVRDILGSVVVNKGLEGVAPGEPEFDFSENGDLYRQFASNNVHTVARADIYGACERLAMFEAPVSGHASKNRDGKMPVIDPYWLDLPKSLQLRMDEFGALLLEGPQVKYYRKHIQPYVDHDPFLSPMEPQTEQWDLDGHSVEFSARGIYAEVTTESESELEQKSQNGTIPVQPTGSASSVRKVTVTTILDLPTVGSLQQKRYLEDALVDELLFIGETASLDASDAKHDIQLHKLDSRREDIKRRKIDSPVPNITSNPPFFDDQWGSTDTENFCDRSLRRAWSRVFPRY